MVTRLTKTACVATLMVVTLLLSGCMSQAQRRHMNDTAYILEIEAERGERVIELLGGNPHATTREEVVDDTAGDSKQIAEFIWQRNQVLRNSAEAIRTTVGGSEER